MRPSTLLRSASPAKLSPTAAQQPAPPQPAPSSQPKKKPAGAKTRRNRGPSEKERAQAAADSSRKIHDFFPIRRSNRKPKAALEEEYVRGIEQHLLVSDDEDLDIRIESFGEKGRGVVAQRDFKKGEFVVEYSGDLIDIGVAKEREGKYSLDLSTGCYMYYFKHKNNSYWYVKTIILPLWLFCDYILSLFLLM